jgi:hypothetical protein
MDAMQFMTEGEKRADAAEQEAARLARISLDVPLKMRAPILRKVSLLNAIAAQIRVSAIH